MKIRISYFYNIRFFKPNQIPVSTALWDPSWFKQLRKDARGVWNGIRLEELNPAGLSGYCPSCSEHNGRGCEFLKRYYEKLERLNFQDIMTSLESIGRGIQAYDGFQEDPEIILMVYETPNNPCSERGCLQDWFMKNGVLLEEWTKDE